MNLRTTNNREGLRNLGGGNDDSLELRWNRFPKERCREIVAIIRRSVRCEAIMIFLPWTRYLGLDARQKHNWRSVKSSAAVGARYRLPNTYNMSPRALLALVAIACIGQAAARPVKKTLNFNMFVLRPKQGASDRFLLSTDGVSRFGPILEMFVQRFQGMMSVKLPHDNGISVSEGATGVPVGNTAENEVDGVQESRMPGIVVRPSRTKPGTYEVEIDMVVDDGQPDEKTQ